MGSIALIATGGTVASRASARGLLADAMGAELLEQSGYVDRPVRVTDLGLAGSYSMGLAELAKLGRHVIGELADPDTLGVVVTHGTDTLEESAFLLDLVLADDRPVVLTGAQRSFDSVAPDGALNVGDALRVATSPQARGRGVLVAFDHLVWSASSVRKVDTYATAAFDGRGMGPVLRTTPEEIVPLSAPARRNSIGLDLDQQLPRVDVIACYLGMDASLIEAAVAAGARGIVLQAFGLGNCPVVVTRLVGDLVRRQIPVVVTTRVPNGPVLPLYSGGGGADLLRAGAIFGADLTPWHARLLLIAALAAAPDAPADLFRAWLGNAHRTNDTPAGTGDGTLSRTAPLG